MSMLEGRFDALLGVRGLCAFETRRVPETAKDCFFAARCDICWHFPSSVVGLKDGINYHQCFSVPE